MRDVRPAMARFVRFGRRVFAVRLFVGLAAVVFCARWLQPVPLFEERHRLAHALALLLIAGGLGVRAWGSGAAGPHTRTARIEAPQLITGGPFAYVRNPIYTGTIVLSFGMALLIGDSAALLCAACALGVLFFVIVPAEETFLRAQFGPEYGRYCAAVPRLIPRLRPWPERREQPFQWSVARGELIILGWLLAIYGGLLFEEYFGRFGIS